MAQNNVWFAVMLDSEDTDRGVGSFDIFDAIDKAMEYRNEGYLEAYIVAVDPIDDFALFDIRDFDKIKCVD